MCHPRRSWCWLSRKPIATAWVIALRVVDLLLNFIPVIILVGTPRWVLDVN